MTKEEWSKAEEALKSFYPPVYLKIDGYDIALRLERISTYKNAIGVYIGGVFKGSWMLEDCEERRRFFQKKVRSLLSAKGKAQLKRMSKKKQKQITEKFHTEYEYYLPYWTSFSALKKHLIANNTSIEPAEVEKEAES